MWIRFIEDGWSHQWLAVYLVNHIRKANNRTVRRLELLLSCADGEIGMARPMLICDQPRTLPPPKMDVFDDRPSTRSSFAPSQWLAEGRGLVSRASSRASFAMNSSRSRRPTIGDPSDFRRVPISDRRRDDFRPLELSSGCRLDGLHSLHPLRPR